MIKLNVNDRHYEVDVEADTPLLWVLRDEIGLTGTKFGCGIAQCGACTVHVDGKPMRSCVLRQALSATGKSLQSNTSPKMVIIPCNRPGWSCRCPSAVIANQVN